ncbi:MAG: hypothetical protein B7C24_13060 [Bacteroidetes bacterium 4572_77]|nr:MAG: hypothetical protein B7C24_13060 [Bacteroidetes bacterium 4572_77]
MKTIKKSLVLIIIIFLGATTFDVFTQTNDSPLNISANPNPATHYVEFIYQLSEIDIEGIIIITDISGKQIKSFRIKDTKGAQACLAGRQAWDTRKIPAGSYIYTLKTKYFEASGKLIIQ